MIRAKGDLATIDVESKTWETISIDGLQKEFIGGRDLATRSAHHRIAFDADSLEHQNRVYLLTSPLQMTQMSFTGRMNAAAHSPLTNGLLSTNAGGFHSGEFVKSKCSCVEFTRG